MIKNVAELLHKLIEKEKEKLKEFDYIKHGTIIGNMYEGLTTSILQKSLPKNLNIQVVSGIIVNSKGELSNQIDCMIVEGEGRKVPYSNDCIYDFSQVLAVIEIKKNLYRT